MIPKSYKATASVLMNLRGVDLVMDTSIRLPTNTHIGILQSRRVALRVVENLGLSSQQRYISSFLKANESGNLDINNFIADKIGDGLSVAAGRRELAVITISYEASSASLAKVMANAFVDAYIETVLEMNNDLPKRTAFWFAKEVDQYKNDYEEAINELNAFQKANGIFDATEFDYEKQFLVQLNTQLFDSQKRLSELSLKISAINQDLSNFGDVVEDQTLEAIRLDLMKAQTSFYKSASVLDKNHPDYKKLLNQVAAMRSFLKKETKTSYEKLISKRDSLVVTIHNLKSRIKSQKDKINISNKKFEGLSELQKQVDELKLTYSQAKDRLNDLSLQAKSNASESEVTVLTRAIEPTEHFKPKLFKIVILGVFFGFVLAISYALLRELVGRKVRIEDDITVSVGLPILGQLEDGAKR